MHFKTQVYNKIIIKSNCFFTLNPLKFIVIDKKRNNEKCGHS